jgi:uncharacterized protein (TIGR03032 family)
VCQPVRVSTNSGATQTATPTNSSDGIDLVASDGFAAWLVQEKVSLVFGTPPAKLWLIGVDEHGELAVFDRQLDKVMGLASAGGDALWVATRYEIWRFENVLAEGAFTDDGHDRVFVPRQQYVTGDVNVHDLALDADGRDLWVNTRFGCLASVSEEWSFVPRWWPPFLSGPRPGDRCHLNGVAMRDGRPHWVTCVSPVPDVDGWRHGRRDGGVVIEVSSGEVVTSGLSMPHSPRWDGTRLWVTNAGCGELGVVDPGTGRYEAVVFAPGFLRGLCLVGDYAVVGSSRPRRGDLYSGLALDDVLERSGEQPRLGLFVVDARAGRIVEWLLIEGPVRELFDVLALPGVRRPMAIGLASDEVRRNIWLPDLSTWLAAPPA